MKYIAKRPAKNISSLESQTIVPTDTMLGRETGPCPGMLPAEREGSEVTADAVATSAIIAHSPTGTPPTPRRVPNPVSGGYRKRPHGSGRRAGGGRVAATRRCAGHAPVASAP
ncbi:hypothetical protein GCM10025782_11030 [Pedococcus ginsenosidimutans]|uniref:Uncharacterized protein n=1 Tax=Pedococcus ginsenosidimutans TaxID=490570 RepID=A0ABP8XW38_9MICO